MASDVTQGGTPRVYTIPSHLPFADSLAAGITEQYARPDDPLALARVLVLLPTRRACRALQEAFLRHSGGRAMLLPRMAPIGDIDEDALEFDLMGDDTGTETEEIPPAIGEMRRRLLLARLVQESAATAAGGQLPVDQAVHLADELSSLLDQVQTERLGFERLADLVPEDYAEHWQLTLQFLELLTSAWPQILAEDGVIDPAARRNMLLAARAEHWRSHPPDTPVIAAGSTGSIPATADLLAVVAQLANGAVVLPGLDQDLGEEAWLALEPSHPQFGLRQLLSRLDVARDQVTDWPAATAGSTAQPGRSAFVGAALRPASVSGEWRSVGAIEASALDGLIRIDCAGPDEEAGVIALIMREVLASPDEARTAALVTPDRSLARRVAGALARWNIVIDDSGGTPLSETPPGVFLRLIAAMAALEAAPIQLLAALKHPLTAGGMATAEFRRLVRAAETALLRGPRRAPGFTSLAEAAAKKAEQADGEQAEDIAAAAALLSRLADIAGPFSDFLSGSAHPLSELVAAHCHFAEALAATDEHSGAERLWAGDAGEALAGFVADLADNGHVLGAIAPQRYPALLEALMAGRPVRPRFGSHPRLAILGPLEARLQRYNVMILGGLNEGTWPPELAADPWMSRPMRRQFGLPQPERRTGLSAHDFTQALGAEEVYLTRSERVDGAPTVPARWLVRMQFAADALDLDPAVMTEQSGQWRAWQDQLTQLPASDEEAPAIPEQIRPNPAPPVVARPRRLSVTEIETWMRDPYAIYARHVLGLRALAPLDQAPDAADYGSRIHAVLDAFLSRYPAGPLPADALERLFQQGEEMLAPIRSRPAVWTFWWPRFQRIAGWFIETETARRLELRETLTELRGSLELAAPAGPFEMVARADRIDRLIDGDLAIIDFKTGAVPREQEVKAGFAPQLPLEAAMAAAGGFTGLTSGTVGKLEYWRLSGGREAGEISEVGGADPGALAQNALAGLQHLVETFDNPATAYESRPRADLAPRYSDYEHLARVKEWSASGDDGGDGA